MSKGHQIIGGIEVMGVEWSSSGKYGKYQSE